MALCTRAFSRALSKLQVIARNSDWFIALFVPVVIGRSYYFGTGFSTVIWKLLWCNHGQLFHSLNSLWQEAKHSARQNETRFFNVDFAHHDQSPLYDEFVWCYCGLNSWINTIRKNSLTAGQHERRYSLANFFHHEQHVSKFAKIARLRRTFSKKPTTLQQTAISHSFRIHQSRLKNRVANNCGV